MFNNFKLLSLSLTIAVVVLYLAFHILKLSYTILRFKFWSPLRTLPGPQSSSFVWGNLREIFKSGPCQLHLKWIDEYGTTIMYEGFFGRPRLMTADSKALAYILNHCYDFPKPDHVRANFAELLGEGIISAEGEAHKQQRRLLNPSFARPYVRESTQIFHEKSIQLRNILLMQLHNTRRPNSDSAPVINICPLLNKATLDIIGSAGFGHEFEALNPFGIENEFNVAFTEVIKVMKESTNLNVLTILRNFIPIFRKIPTRQSGKLAQSSQVMNRVASDLVHFKKEEILSNSSKKDVFNEIGKDAFSGKDILSRLLAANMATDLPQHQRLSDRDLYSQISTFIIAGHETTSTAVAWALFVLGQDLSVQNTLREELLLVETDTPSMDELDALPYLDSVVKETLRLHPPISSAFRISARDDLIPLNTPFKDKNGILRHEIPIRKGDLIYLPILVMHLRKDIWGDDALEFRPERWTSDSEKNRDIPGVYANTLSFLGGPRACIGYRFAIIEMKCILFALIRSFQFELAVPVEEIEKKTILVTRPILKSAPKDGYQLPLKITRLK